MRSFNQLRSILLAVVALLFGHTLLAAEPITIGDRRELFVDRALIEKADGVELRMHTPQPAGVALQFDRPWEGAYSCYFTVLEDRAVHRMYFSGRPLFTEDKDDRSSTCYAESRDGITWNKPDVGLCEVGGNKNNNVLLQYDGSVTHNFAPFRDTKPGIAADARYKALGGLEQSLWAFTSSDGVHWRRLQAEPVVRNDQFSFDSQNVAFWSEAENCYVCYFRTWKKIGKKNFRAISRATSQDFVQWSAGEEMHYGDAPFEQLYTNQTFPYFRAPHIYIALPMRFFPNRAVIDDATFEELPIDARYKSQTRRESSDGVLMTSRGGNRYDRTFLDAFMRPGLDAGNWVSRAMLSARGVLQTGPAEMSVYYQQHYGQPSARLMRYTLRLDGFASAHAGYSAGTLLTKPFVFKGNQLEINFSTGAGGGVKVELQNVDGTPLPGYSLADATETVGDAVQRQVSWKDWSNVGKLAGKPVRLLFELRDADLYSYRFRP
jgi:hypothetical protein